MKSCQRLIFGLSLLAWGFAVSAAKKPMIMHDIDEIVVPNHGLLNLTCRGERPVSWYADTDMLHYDTYEEDWEEGHEKPHIAILVMSNVNYTAVGYYMCFFNTTDNLANIGEIQPDNPNVDSIYVYVKDEQNLLTHDTRGVFFPAEAGKPFIVPCKPTFPEVEVTLEKSQGDFIRLQAPRVGFDIVADEMNNHITCKAEFGEFDQSQHVILTFDPQTQLKRPNVEVIDPWQRNLLEGGEAYDVVAGATFNLSCTLEATQHRVLEWIMPDTANLTGGKLIYRYQPSNSPKMERVLKVQDASPLDDGEYECIATGTGKTSDPYKINVNIIEKDEKYVTLVAEDPEVFAETNSPDFASWVINVRAHPMPIFIWRKGDKVLLNTSNNQFKDNRFEIKTELFQEGQINLRITPPTLSDVGKYTLEARINGTNTKAQVALNFTMEEEPKIISLNYSPSKTMWRHNEKFKITCEATGYPKPFVDLQFKSCSSKFNCSSRYVTLDTNERKQPNPNELSRDPNIIQLEHEIVKEKISWIGRALTSGQFRCLADNTYKETKGDVLRFHVTDATENDTLSMEVTVNGKGVSGHSLPILEGDSVRIACYGNKMQTSENLHWQMDGKALGAGDSLAKKLNKSLTKRMTDYSYITEIAIQKVELRNKSFTLTCIDNETIDHSVTKKFTVKAMEKPAWKDNKSQLEDSYNKKELDNITLKCDATGAPAPETIWYKDGEILQDAYVKTNGNEIHFPFLQTSNSGTYKCVVTNRAGTIEAETHLTVTDPDALFDHRTMIIIVCISILVMIVIVIFFCVRIIMDRKRAYSLRLEDHRMFIEGAPENLNPEIGLDQQADLLPYDHKFEVSRDSIIFDKLLGSGAFGRVYRATAIGLRPGQPRATVAVKMMKSRTDCAQLKALRSELKIMIHIGRHVNIVNLLGACSKDFASKGELLLLVEYCRHGNILDYMRRHRRDFVHQINENDKIDPSITDNRMRQRSGSGSRIRGSRGLKYAHLNFTPDSVSYNVGEESNGTNSAQAVWSIDHEGFNGSHNRQSFRSRTMSGSSNQHHVASDMSTMTYESSNGVLEDYIPSNGLAGATEVNFCSKTLLLWAFQIAKGMEYLAFKKVLHGDLAARNILLAEDNVVKISDFGLAKDIYKNENYRKKSDGPVPVKWLALESLRDAVFSTQSDIWSYGVVLWEIFSLGQNPYSGVDFDENFITKLEKGVRLEQPRYSTYDLYCVMNDCWEGNPLDRPSFSVLEARLGDMIGEAERQYYLELNQPYQIENTDSTFLSRLQSPDYSLKVREGSPTVDQDGYEVPFSPSPCGAVALPFADPQTPRHTILQMNFLQNCDEQAVTYMAMSTPGHRDQTAFDFDDEAVKNIAKRESEALQDDSDLGEDESDGANDVKYLAMETPGKPITPTETECLVSPNISLRPKVARQTSDMGKHDSGLYSPTVMQNNPSYVMMNSFMKTDENNYLTREDACDMNKDNPQYLNFTSFKKPKAYPKEGCTDSEYANLLNSESRGRTISEASSGVGSLAEDSPPEMRSKHIINEAIMEEPIAV